MNQPAWKYDINDEREDLPLWNVTFTGSYGAVMTSIYAENEQDAVTLAHNFLMDYYDFNLDPFKAEATLAFGEGDE